MELSVEQVRQLIPQIQTVIKERGTPDQIRVTAKKALAVLMDKDSSGQEKYAAVQPLVEQINRFVLQYALDRPGPPSYFGLWPPKGALPVPDDTPWAPGHPRRKGTK